MMFSVAVANFVLNVQPKAVQIKSYPFSTIQLLHLRINCHRVSLTNSQSRNITQKNLKNTPMIIQSSYVKVMSSTHSYKKDIVKTFGCKAKSKNEKNYFGSNIIEKTRSRFAKKGAKKVEQRNDESNEWRLKIIRGQLWRPISQKRGLKERRIFGLPIILKKNFEVQKKQLWDINERPWVPNPCFIF